MTEKKPFEIARETLKQITTRKLMPTPVNYQAIYNELAGTPTVPPFPADALRDIAQALPAKTPGQQKQRGLLEYAIDRLNWDGVKTALVAYGGFVPPSTADSVVTGNAGTNAGLNAGATAVATTVGAVGSAALTADFMGQVGRLIEFAQPALGDDDARFVEQTQALLKAIRQPDMNAASVKLMIAGFLPQANRFYGDE